MFTAEQAAAVFSLLKNKKPFFKIVHFGPKLKVSINIYSILVNICVCSIGKDTYFTREFSIPDPRDKYHLYNVVTNKLFYTK